MKNYSQQRETVLRILRATNTHPTADWIYAEARKELPHISLGTVYRNLGDLVNDGLAISVPMGDGKEHFDGDVSTHLHFHCKTCGKLWDMPLEKKPFAKEEKRVGFSCENSLFVLEGTCEQCKK